MPLTPGAPPTTARPRVLRFPGPLASAPSGFPGRAARSPHQQRPRRASAGWAAVTPAPAGRRGPAPDSLSRRQPLGGTQSHLHWPPRGRGLPQLSQRPGAWGAPAGPLVHQDKAGRPALGSCALGGSPRSRAAQGPDRGPPTARVRDRLLPTPPGTVSGLPGWRGSACAVGSGQPGRPCRPGEAGPAPTRLRGFLGQGTPPRYLS